MKINEDITSVIFFARGGQGAKTATEILAQAAILEGKFVKAFPDFGPERSGAPIKTYLRISQGEIRTSEPILSPDIAVVLDETVLESDNIKNNLAANKDEIMIVNSRKNSGDVASTIPEFKGKIYVIDATGLAMETIGKPTPNIVILGYLIKIAEIVKMSNVIKVFESIFNAKIGEESTKKNILAMEKAYDNL
ncbi:MAG: 2-oxoacid:acceptor oxidoreductase family protein [bacterium]|nr:2-oxoacid:acceptor oxidoreductase family protein [bacterium]